MKCSGDRSGCQRCQSLAADCIYTESRVGKVPGARAKKKQPPGASVSTTTTSAEVQGRQALSAPAVLPPKSSVHNPFSDVILDWTTDLPNLNATDTASFNGIMFDDGTNLFENSNDTNGTTTASSHTSSIITSGENFSSLGDDLMVSDLDFSIESATHEQSRSSHQNSNDNSNDSQAGGAESSTRREPALDHLHDVQSQPPNRDLDSRCVLACTHIISNLENYILLELKALDLSLTVVRQTINELSRLVDTQQASRSFRCMALFSVIIYQIVELLEVGCVGFLSESQIGSTNGFPDWLRDGGTPGLGFGAFRMDAREQRAWRADIVLKELQQISETLQKIITLARLGPRQACQGTSEERAACYSELERRLQALWHKVAQYKE